MADPSLLPHPARHQAMLARYGFGLFPVPRYQDAAVGSWRVARYGRGPVEGYLPGAVLEPERHVLHHGRTAWMSTSLMELESHAFHVHQAVGVVVVAGLGMAMYAHAAVQRPEVLRVVVVEQAKEVIAVARAAAGMDRWPRGDKVRIVQGDALGSRLADLVLDATGGRRPDYLYADIWAELAAPQAPDDTARMVLALQPKAAGWWGQELSFGRWCQEHGQPAEPATLQAYAQETGVPIPVSAGYAAFCRDVAAARLPRRPAAGQPSGWRRLWARLRGAGSG
ncbi:MAG TPA: hypothetical protein VNS22_07720 [Geminicoccus sp.]|uniref:hypothetical protein n=1 Tax=Geminicoccus sp. TaxID=2024832 RepID=UPI002BB50C72|nr:hypothetical protein [Geminicoccus sp.]HWL68260.1 hypothetical protein [Geminicoccus sp.]